MNRFLIISLIMFLLAGFCFFMAYRTAKPKPDFTPNPDAVTWDELQWYIDHDTTFLKHGWSHNLSHNNESKQGYVRSWITPEPPMDTVIITPPLQEGDYLTRSILTINGRHVWYNEHRTPKIYGK